ncbi:hypothetical protein RHGRI_009092 [Rhododendron griersonianum]|uniref:Uncharacterized protein n=4 Tax=Rhododendron griersonianum TaxID=479676 RepID=A0AAV6L594_9ERIC|nr:hypothetical protein RHGRI_009092 [Rhododendron griersonianum]
MLARGRQWLEPLVHRRKFQRPGAKRRDREQIDRDSQAEWEASIKERGVKNERHIVDDGLWPANFEPFAAIRDQGLRYWFAPNPGYNNALCEEFYKNMVVPEPGHFLAPGARITSRIGNTPVFIDVAEIATALDYQRPTRPVNFPRPDETFDQNEIAGYLYEHRKNARIPHWPGRFTTAYRFINQVVCFNLYPRDREGAPQRSVGNLMYAFMGEDTVSDWALYIFGQMCDFRDAPTTLRMPFPCLVTKILRTRNVPGKRFYSNEDLLPGDLDSSFIQRSMAQLRGIEGSLLSPPPASASTKTWLEKIFGCLTGLARSQRKLKREQRQLARNQADLLERQRHMEAQLSGQNPGPFQHRRWPALEVSDDFADEPEEEEHSDAGDGN